MYQIEFDNEILRQKINSQCLTLDGYHLAKLYSILLVYPFNGNLRFNCLELNC